MGYNTAAQVSWVDYPYLDGTVRVGTLWKSENGDYAVLTGIGYYGVYFIRRKVNGTWLPWEYENSNLEVGKEYRTTERYKGQQIYKKVDTDGIIKWRLENETTWKTVAEYIGATNTLQNDIVIYISADGDDITGDGSQTKPYRQIQTAINKLPKNLGNHDVIIKLSAGTYNGANISNFYGAGGGSSYGALQIMGNSRDDTFIAGQLYFFNCNIRISVSQVHVSNNSGNQYEADIQAYGNIQNIVVNNCIVDGTCGYGLYLTAFTNFINNVLCNNKAVAVMSEWLCLHIGVAGTNNTIGFQAGSDSSGVATILIGHGLNLSASTLYQKLRGSIIFNQGVAV